MQGAYGEVIRSTELQAVFFLGVGVPVHVYSSGRLSLASQTLGEGGESLV